MQEEFGNNLKDEIVSAAENKPILGHLIATGHYIAGNKDKGDDVLWGATKGIIVGGATTAAASACGPAAGACGAAAAIGSSAAYDGVHSVASGQQQGIIKGPGSSPGEVVDFLWEQGNTIHGGKKTGDNQRTGRSRVGGNDIHLPRLGRSVENIALPKELESKLPKSFHDIDLTYDVTTNTADLVSSVTGLFLVIQLMISGHPKGRPYLDEICSSVYPTELLEV